MPGECSLQPGTRPRQRRGTSQDSHSVSQIAKCAKSRWQGPEYCRMPSTQPPPRMHVPAAVIMSCLALESWTQRYKHRHIAGHRFTRPGTEIHSGLQQKLWIWKLSDSHGNSGRGTFYRGAYGFLLIETLPVWGMWCLGRHLLPWLIAQSVRSRQSVLWLHTLLLPWWLLWSLFNDTSPYRSL